MRLLYIADPLCSWCYGFGPELARVLERHPDAELELLMGGLRPYNTEPMSERFKEMLRGHWKDASGLPFSEAILGVPGFVYDTEPPCRAVVTARALFAGGALGFMKAIQSAFYRDGLDVTRAAALADLAQASGYGREAFVTRFESQAAEDETRADFAQAQALGVSGFPTLALAHGRELFLVTSGFVAADVLEQRLEAIAQRCGA